jgi:hypothetical protein
MAINARITDNGFYLHLTPFFIRGCRKTESVYFGIYGKMTKEMRIGKLEDLLPKRNS